jgi:uncharacterized metal-binding protein YceD (DUF177 family)
VDYLRQFVIPFKGLKPGEYQYDFDIDDLFFESFEYSELKKGQVHVHLDMMKEESMMDLRFRLEGKVTVPCDRCLEMMDLPVEGDEELIIKFGSDFHEESESIQVIPEGETQIDVSTFIYEYIHLLVPVRKVHPDDEEGNSSCDPEILKRIDTIMPPSEPDPRWEALKKLKPKN